MVTTGDLLWQNRNLEPDRASKSTEGNLKLPSVYLCCGMFHLLFHYIFFLSNNSLDSASTLHYSLFFIGRKY